MKVLVVGGGSREHALAWKIAQSPLLTKLYVAPGNPGTEALGENLGISKIPDILSWLDKNPVDLVVVGPDNYLADGLVDEVEKRGIPAFGPTKEAAEIEWSKRYAKELMQEAGIPTAAYQSFTEFEKAKAYVASHSLPVVIKASGLAYGKGAIVATSREEALRALHEIMVTKVFGTSGEEVVVEEFLEGKEISIHALCDGERAVLFPSSQDHKRALDGDKGLNTGGMGTIAPVPWVTHAQMEEVRRRIVDPVLSILRKKGRPYRGLLYPGLMMTSDGPKVVEFNARFGMPETESYMRLLESDLLPILLACAKGHLDSVEVKWRPGASCCVIAASAGYPGDYAKGKEIHGLNTLADPDVVVFHVGTKREGEKLLTNGGRVLGVTATGSDLREALRKAYSALGTISFEGMRYRKDIGAKSLS